MLREATHHFAELEIGIRFMANVFKQADRIQIMRLGRRVASFGGTPSRASPAPGNGPREYG